MPRQTDNQSVWGYINSFRESMKEQMRNILSAIGNSRQMIKNMATQSYRWLRVHLSGLKENGKALIRWSAHNLSIGIRAAWNATYYVLTHLPHIVMQTLRQGYRAGFWLLKNTFNLMKAIAIGLKDLTWSILLNSQRLCRYVFNNLGNIARFMWNAFTYVLKNLPKIGLEIARILKDCTIELAKGLYRLGKFIVLNSGKILKDIVVESFKTLKWLVTSAAKNLWFGVGMTIGFGAALFDVSVDLMKSLFAGNSEGPQVRRPRQSSNDEDIGVEVSPRTMTNLYRRHASRRSSRGTLAVDNPENGSEMTPSNRRARA